MKTYSLKPIVGLYFWLLLVFISLLAREIQATGACTAARFHDWNDMGCNQNNAGLGSPDMSTTCPSGLCKPPKAYGMPRWWVSEPYINLCMKDTPLSYSMSSGKQMEFSFYYRQRTKLPDSDEIIALPTAMPCDIYPTAVNCGNNASWGNNWNLSITIWDPTWESSWVNGVDNTIRPPYAPYTRGYQVFVWRPEGGINYFNVQNGQQNIYDPRSLMRLTSVTNGQNYPVVSTKVSDLQVNNAPTADANGIYWGNPGVGLTLAYPDGSQDVFGLTPFPIIAYSLPYYYLAPGASNSRLLLTQRIDPQGRVTHLGYDYITNASPYGYYYFRLHYVVDPDGRTNTFNYGSGLQISEVDDPYGRKVSLGYSSSPGTGGLLNQITDAAGNRSSFNYQPGPQTQLTNPATQLPYSPPRYVYLPSSGWMTSLITPYGTNLFNYYNVTDSSVTDGYQQRAIYVTEPTGANQLYYYLHRGVDANGNPLFSATATAPTVPGQTNFDDGNSGINHPTLNYRNSIYWGRRQISNLSSNVLSALPNSLSNALSNLTASDFSKGRVRNWLWQTDSQSISESISSELDPSPDPAGQIAGQRIWYNYHGKTLPEMVGSSPQVACVAKILPDGTTNYITYNYYATTPIPGYPVGAGLVSDNESTFSKPDGTTGVLTNWFQYSANSVDLISISNSAGQYLNYGYNGSHQVASVTNALNQVTTLSWDTYTHNLTGVQLPAGKNYTLNYYAGATSPTSTSFMLQSISISPEGRSFTINNYSAGLPSNITDDRGLTVANTWDGLNRLTSTSFPDGTSISKVYSRLDLVGTKDRLNNWTRYSYDGLQHLTTVTNANNAVTSYSWCGCGSLQMIVDALSNPTYLNYDNQGNLTNVSFPDNSSVTYQFDLAGRMTNAFDGFNRKVQVAYNNQGLPISITGANGPMHQRIFDAVNRVISMTDANGITVTNQYDAINELTKRTWPDGIGEGYGYNATGLIAYTNRDQQVTRYVRDGAGRLTAVTNANLEVTQFGYDSLNNMTFLIDGLQHWTSWHYNEYGWLTNKVDGNGHVVQRYVYDANGRVTSRWTPEKGSAGYTYDNVGNLKSVTYPQYAVSYAYDELNRLTNMVDLVGATGFGYTPAGRLQSENGPWASDSLALTYAQGLRTVLSLTQPAGAWSQTNAYDGVWRLTNVVSPAGAFGYSLGEMSSASPLIKTISLPNGGSITNGYDALARLTQTSLNNNSGATLDGYGYQYDALGLRTNLTRNFGTASATVTAAYDALGQLTNWVAQETGGASRLNEQLGFGYDAAHNLHGRTDGGLSEGFTVDAANQLTGLTRSGKVTVAGNTLVPVTGVTVNGASAPVYADLTFANTNTMLVNGVNTLTTIAQNAGGAHVTNNLSVNLPASATLYYDANGNLTNDGVRSLSYDVENELATVQVAGQWQSTFMYDGLGRRRIQRDYAWASGTWVRTNEVHYVYDGNLILQERDANNNPLVTYTRGADLSGTRSGAGGIGGLLARTDNNGSTYYHADGSGNITALVNGSQNIVARYLYNPFGLVVGKWGSLADANTMQFSSMPHHNLSGLSLYAYRGYSPNLQRWLNQDPIGERGGLNLYAYVQNNPVNRIDPLGLEGNPISSTLPGLSGAWNNNASGGGGSFYGPGFYQSLAIQQANAAAAAQAAAIAAYNATMPSDFWLDANGNTMGGLQTDDGIFALLAPFLAPDAAGLSTAKKCPGFNYAQSAMANRQRLAFAHNAETGETAFAGTHGAAMRMISMPADEGNLGLGLYDTSSWGFGNITIENSATINSAAAESSQRAVISILEPK